MVVDAIVSKKRAVHSQMNQSIPLVDDNIPDINTMHLLRPSQKD